MFLLARHWLSHHQAILAAVFYVANPYHLVIVYWRSAMAELLAAAYLPLLLLFLWRSQQEGLRAVSCLSLVIAAGWLTNIPSAVMMNYSLAALALYLAITRRRFAVLGATAASVVLGVLLAGVYLVPAFHQQNWINIAQALGPGVRPIENFLFTATNDSDHNRFNSLVSIVASSEIVITLILLPLTLRVKTKPRSLAIVWSVLSIVLMFRPALIFWNHLPKMNFVQFPWRWLLCLNVPFALLLTMATGRSWIRMLLYATALAVVFLGWYKVQAPWWDSSADIREMVDNQQQSIGNEGTDEYVPAGVDPYDIDPNAARVRFEGSGAADIRVPSWLAEKRLIIATTTTPGNLLLRLFNYPLWRVEVNGDQVPSGTKPHTGELLIPVTTGKNRVQVSFCEDWDRRLGMAISGLALTGVGWGFWRSRAPTPLRKIAS